MASSFQLRRPAGGAYAGTTDYLRGPEAAALQASLAGQASVSAALTTSIRAAATLAAACTVTASLTTAIPLVSSMSAQASFSGTLSDYIVPLPPPRGIRAFEQFIRGPAASPTYFLGSVDAFREGAQHTANISKFFEPADGGGNLDFGFVGQGTFDVEIVSTPTAPLDLTAIANAWRDQELVLEIVTRFSYEDGTTSETTNVRRAVVKKVTRRRSVLSLSLADIDRAALDQIFPFESFTVADFPRLYQGHVGRLVRQGVGYAIRAPLTWIDDAGPHVFAGPKVLSAAGALLAVYRGTADGQGSLVDPSEYTAGTATSAVSGYVVNTVSFDQEQIDFNGQPYVLEADYLLPGSRLAADEIARICALYGITVDPSAVAAASGFDAASGIFVDCLHGGGNGRAGSGIIEDLLRIARGWLVRLADGSWDIAQDRPSVPIMTFRSTADEIDVEEYGDGDRFKTVTIDYRPQRDGLDSDLRGHLERTTSAASGTFQIKTPFVYDHQVADRLNSYYAALVSSRTVATAAPHAVQLDIGKVITIEEPLIWTGALAFLIEGNQRQPDSNRLSLRQTADLYSYTPGSLPADASNVYGPDYSFTPPEAPTIQTPIAAGSTATDIDGKVQASQLIQISPPAVNWAILTVQLTDTTNQAIYQAQAIFNSVTGFYEVTFGGLPPNRSMQARAWATNANNVDGNVAGPVAFTSATSPFVPSAPAAVIVAQTQSKQIDYFCSKVTPAAGAPPIELYIFEQSINGGAFAEIYRGKGNQAPPQPALTGSTYQGRVKVEDRAQNQSAYRTGNTITAAKQIDDTFVIGAGISGTSIANNSINQGRESSTTQSQSGTMSAGAYVPVGISGSAADYAYTPALTVGNSGSAIGTIGLLLTPAGGTAFTFYLHNNDAASQPYDAEWRQVSP